MELCINYFSGNGSKLHKENFAPRVNFAQVIFLHKSKKKQKKKDKLIKKQKEIKITDRGYGLGVTVIVNIKITNKNY